MKPSKTSLMCTILAVALALRLINLTTSLWYDELYTYVNFIRGGPADALLRYRAANNHPLYSFCAWLSLCSTPGSLELSLRLPALLLGLTTIALLMRRGGALLGAPAGLIGAALLSLAPAHALYSQEARGYTGASLFVTLALLSAASQRTRRDELTLTAAIPLAIWFHAASGLVTLSLGLSALGASSPPRRALRRAWLLGHLLALICYLPILKRTMGFARRHVLGSHEQGVLDRLTQMLTALCSWDRLGIVGALLVTLVVLGAVSARRGTPEQRRFSRSALVGAGALALFWSLPGTLFFPRFVLFIQPALLALAGIGGAELARASRRPSLVVAGLLVAAATLQLPTFSRLAATPQQDLRGALRLAERWARGDLVVAGGTGGELLASYASPGVRFVEGHAELDELLSEGGRLIYIEPFAGGSVGLIAERLGAARRARVLAGLRHKVKVYELAAKSGR